MPADLAPQTSPPSCGSRVELPTPPSLAPSGLKPYQPSQPSGWYLLLKVVFESVFALSLLVLLGPMILLFALLVLLDVPGSGVLLAGSPGS